jgi:hypothetical protein
MAYVLEMGTLQVVPMPRTYMRRAQATLHRTVWRQIAVCESAGPLEEMAAEMSKQSGVEYRITGVGQHCRAEPVTIRK